MQTRMSDDGRLHVEMPFHLSPQRRPCGAGTAGAMQEAATDTHRAASSVIPIYRNAATGRRHIRLDLPATGHDNNRPSLPNELHSSVECDTGSGAVHRTPRGVKAAAHGAVYGTVPYCPARLPARAGLRPGRRGRRRERKDVEHCCRVRRRDRSVRHTGEHTHSHTYSEEYLGRAVQIPASSSTLRLFLRLVLPPLSDMRYTSRRSLFTIMVETQQLQQHQRLPKQIWKRAASPLLMADLLSRRAQSFSHIWQVVRMCTPI